MSNPTDLSNVHIESTLPRAWEQEHTFNDSLYEWMSRAPWLALSFAAHVVVAVILMAIPWELLESDKSKALQASIEQAPEEVFEDPPPEEKEEIEEEVVEEPVLKDAEEINEDVAEVDLDSMSGDPELNADSPFNDKGLNDIIGIGGGAGGKFGNRGGGNRNSRAGGGSGVEQSIKDGLEWLKHHQSPDGSWDSDGFMANCGKIAPGSVCTGPGESVHDVGLTGLALLAFMGDGHTTTQGPYRDVVARGLKWLKEQQDPDTGLLGEKIGHSYMYNHAIATLAICEAYYFSKSPTIKRTAQDAVNLISQARVPYGAWRYHFPPEGDNDTSITGWMVFALKSAEEAKLEIDKEAFVGARTWLDEVTDPATGRAGYTERGSLSSRIPNVNEKWPREKGEAMTAVALMSRFFMGQDPAKEPIMEKHAQILKAKPPKWDPDGLSVDVYYWYYGFYAMFQMGTFKGVDYWKSWQTAMKSAMVESQSKVGDEKGSWEPSVDAWGSFHGGRVYMTAFGVLCLEVYFRYTRLVGSR
jgi:hypothetical protein